MDVEDIGPGENFADRIDRSIASCQMALVVIGPRWVEILRSRAQASEPDYVAHEIASALSQKLRVVPILVGGASMPRAADLPASLAGLPFLQAAELRDSTFREDCERLGRELGLPPSPEPGPKPERRSWPLPLLAIAPVVLVAALLGFFVLRSFWNPRGLPSDPRMATARTQMELGEYRSAFRTYGEMVKAGVGGAAVEDLQTDAAMAWLRDFHVLVGEGEKPEQIAGPPLAEMIGVLEAALARAGSQGSRAADLLAHLGWAHWLNRHIAHLEFGPAAERNLRQAVAVDGANVYANAFLGNWLLQNNGDVAEALRYFHAAENASQERPLVRQMELGGFLSREDPAVPPALMRVANSMRLGGEPISDRIRKRVIDYFRPGNGEEIRAMLTAVAPADALATFEWLDRKAAGDEGRYEGFRRAYVRALILEMEGKTGDARTTLEELTRQMRTAGFHGRLENDVAEALRRVGR